jgi:hypothetical protein
MAVAALQVLDGAHAEASTLGQPFLCEPGGQSMLAQQSLEHGCLDRA